MKVPKVRSDKIPRSTDSDYHISHQSEFHKALSAALTRLRKVDKQKRQQLYGANCPEHAYSSGDEDEYHARPVKRLKSS